MKLKHMLNYARILITEDASQEYNRGITELLAMAFPEKGKTPEETAKTYLDMIIPPEN